MEVEVARRRIVALRRLGAFISLTDERGPGTVVAVKDLVDVAGCVTTGGGAMPQALAEHDAPVVTGLRAAGCLVVGKTNLHEWAYGVTSENPHYGAVLNPHDETRVAGGSSGGAAVAAATGMCDWALGSDTGGSIRIPASLCGVVGLKPTYGSIPVTGVIPLSPSLDTLGPLAGDVAGVAWAWQALGGAPPAPAGGEPRLATPRDWIVGLDPETEAAWSSLARQLTPIDFPDRARLAAIGDTILGFEAAAYHRRWLELYPNRYGADVRGRLLAGGRRTRDEYGQALAGREWARREAEAALSDWDALVLPATAMVAPKRGEDGSREPLTRFTRPFNTTGQPVVCLPYPVPGLPVGMQLVGHLGAEAELLRVASHLEAKWAAASPAAAPRWSTTRPA